MPHLFIQLGIVYSLNTAVRKFQKFSPYEEHKHFCMKPQGTSENYPQTIIIRDYLSCPLLRAKQRAHLGVVHRITRLLYLQLPIPNYVVVQTFTLITAYQNTESYSTN